MQGYRTEQVYCSWGNAGFGMERSNTELSQLRSPSLRLQISPNFCFWRKANSQAALSEQWKLAHSRRARVYQPRYRRNYLGEMVQIVGSHHDWCEGQALKFCLLLLMGDAPAVRYTFDCVIPKTGLIT